ncbi:MAG TPA: heavy metal-binding domain-containing protein [Chloroflexia bacterium]|nr:heavy metal-binding domain-containing protein [Chloroflexia bacterium]
MTSKEHLLPTELAADSASSHFSTDPTGLPGVTPTQVVELQDGDVFALRPFSVAKQIGEATLRMLAYNGSIPGPMLHVKQGSEITVQATNDGDIEATIHWHGLRLDNRYDGAPYDTQAPIPIGGTFDYKLRFPDPGLYWYHPYLREDYAMELGLYGTIVVEPADPAYWSPVDRQLVLTLDDLLVEDGQIAPFSRSEPNFTAMGRFGNVLLINGETSFSSEAILGEVVRLYLVNTANTRIFNFAVRGARMKLVGGDSGRYEQETFVNEVLLSPSERVVVDVLFDTAREVRLEHRTPDRVYDLGSFSVIASSPTGRSFEALRTDPQLAAIHQSIKPDLEREPDKTLAFVSAMPLLYGGNYLPVTEYECPMHHDITTAEPGICPKCGMNLLPVHQEQELLPPTSYVCPMHPEVTATEQETCPKCGMKLVPEHPEILAPTTYACPMHPHNTAKEPTRCPECGMKLISQQQEIAAPAAYVCPMHPEIIAAEPSKCPECGMKLVPSAAPALAAPAQAELHQSHPHSCHEQGGDGLEWEDLMPEINRASNPTNMIWNLIDREAGTMNGAISWEFRVGDRVKIRVVNEMESDPPCTTLFTYMVPDAS